MAVSQKFALGKSRYNRLNYEHGTTTTTVEERLRPTTPFWGTMPTVASSTTGAEVAPRLTWTRKK